eukprot:352093-Chlamydomonas_euryale.AAC.3
MELWARQRRTSKVLIKHLRFRALRRRARAGGPAPFAHSENVSLRLGAELRLARCCIRAFSRGMRGVESGF